jgi:hypothetical protein
MPYIYIYILHTNAFPDGNYVQPGRIFASGFSLSPAALPWSAPE